MVDVGEGERSALVYRFHDLPEPLHRLVRVNAELPRVFTPRRIDKERLDDNQAGAALGAPPVVGHVA